MFLAQTYVGFTKHKRWNLKATLPTFWRLVADDGRLPAHVSEGPGHDLGLRLRRVRRGRAGRFRRRDRRGSRGAAALATVAAAAVALLVLVVFLVELLQVWVALAAGKASFFCWILLHMKLLVPLEKSFKQHLLK